MEEKMTTKEFDEILLRVMEAREQNLRYHLHFSEKSFDIFWNGKIIMAVYSGCTPAVWKREGFCELVEWYHTWAERERPKITYTLQMGGGRRHVVR